VTSQPRDTPPFYLTPASPCPYLPDRQERKVFTHLVGGGAQDLNDVLSQGGFRRSQTIAYRPACEGCRACISTRVVVDDFKPSKTDQRILKRNHRLIGSVGANQATSEQYSLFRRYVTSRHADGGMVDMTMLDFAMMIEESHVNTSIVEYRFYGIDTHITGRGEGDLIACALIDKLKDGLSMVYSFYDPERTDLSLGTFMILDHIRRTHKQGLPYLYLGYWVDGSPKMGYKARFLPQQRLQTEGWVLHTERT
jgi:leucyl-tRNA---protein transferase